MMKDFEPAQLQSSHNNSAITNNIKMQSQLSNLTYRKSKPNAAALSLTEPQYDLMFDVVLEGTPVCQIPLRATKNTRSEEILRHVLHQLSSDGYQRRPLEHYSLSEVVYDDLGQVCKDRRLTLDDHPVKIQLLWPKEQVASDSKDLPRETYAFRITDVATDESDQGPHSTWIECDLASYFASDSFLHKFFSDDNTVADLCQLPELTETSILDNLRERFEEGRIYTAAGPSILVSINPYKFYPLYNPKVVSLYQSDIHPSLKLPPHIFAIADTAYSTMLRHRRDQCVVISGESGSGKTECTHFILHHLTALSHKGQQGGRIEQSILSAAPVLEAFGNAKTSHNNNSSRFGKYIQVHYKPDGKVARANVQQYLLEKSRIVSQARNERNYHVFYYMLAGSDAEEKSKLRLDSIESYDYLNQSDYADMSGFDCTFEFDRLKQAMEMVGFTRELQTRIFSVLSAVLHIGNIQYVKKASSYHHDESVIIQNREVLATVATLLQVNEELLHSALISKCAIAYNEALIMNYKLPEAINARDALAKLLYCSMFDWIVNQTNRLLNPKSSKEKEVSIGVLDIFGFENFERNSFEQFCINYANEHLQSYFNLHVFKYEQDEYMNEGIDWSPIAYTDNSPCLDLIQQKPYGLLPLLNEECSFPGATNETLLEKYRRHQVTNEHFGSPQKRENAFIVHHYAGTVKYDVKNFREKNSDVNRATDLVTLLKTSTLGLLREMVAESPTAMARWRMLKLTVFTVLTFSRRTRRKQSFSVESSSPPKGAFMQERGSLTGGLYTRGIPVGGKRNFSPQAASRQHRTMDLASHAPSVKPRRGVSNQTVTSQFQQSLTKLMEALNKADPYFIRCIKANNSKTPGLFDEETVLRQLHYSGMLETVRIRRSGYHIRLPFKDFVNSYHALFPKGSDTSSSDIRLCLLRWGLDPNNFQIGHQKIYLREAEKQRLDDILHRLILRNIVKIQRWWRVSHLQLRERARRPSSRMIDRKLSTVEAEEGVEEEEDEEPVPLSSSPASHATNGHVTPFSSFSSDWNSHHSDEGVQLLKTTSSEDLPQLPGRLIIAVQPQKVTRRRVSDSEPPERLLRRDSEEESSGILDDSEPETTPTLQTQAPPEKVKPAFPTPPPRAEPKWRRYSAIEQHHILQPIPQPSPAKEKEPEERAIDVYNEKAVDVDQLEDTAVKPSRPSPPKQLIIPRTSRRDTIPKRDHFDAEAAAAHIAAEHTKSGKMGSFFKNWLDKKKSIPKKKSLGENEPPSPADETPQISPEVSEVEKPAILRSGAGRVPLKHHQGVPIPKHSPPPVKSTKALKAQAKRAQSAHAKAPVGESILQPLTRTFSKNRLQRRQAQEDSEMLKEKEPVWNIRSITQFTDSEDRVVSSAEELRELENFIFEKITQMDYVRKGQNWTKADKIFQQGMRTFRINLISTYSVAVKDARLCIRYRDLIVNFEKTIRVECYKIVHSQSPPFTTAALAQYKSDDDGFPVNMAINAFRSFMNEFMQKQQLKQKQEETKMHRSSSKKRKQEPAMIHRQGHQLGAVNIFNLPTACEVCTSFLWPMEKSLVCQLCKTTCHKKCYQKIETPCTGKRKIKKSATMSPSTAAPALANNQPSGKIFKVPLDCLLLSGEKIPAIADRLITVVEMQGIYTEWIYRKSGAAHGMRSLRAAIEDNPDKIDWDQYHDAGIHIVASTFKALLREMPEPLMTFERYDELMDIMARDDRKEKLENVYCAIRKMQKPNHDLLERLFFHLARVAQQSSMNQMTPENLAIVFAPCLFRSERDLKAFEVSDDYKKQIECIQIVIDAQLEKLQLTLNDIVEIDTQAVSANTRLSVIRSSKVFVAPTNVPTGPNIPETIPDVDEEERRLSDEIQSLRKEKEKRALDLASLRLSRQASLEGSSHSSEEDLSGRSDIWQPQPRKPSAIPSRPHRRDQTNAPKQGNKDIFML
ncbi:unconventional myosin-IXAa-like isoform X2 [Paramacrobiotus metropolitanus]|uniref:unconventional myosin-IXAa-like isoform X2 n=1 Tax=Paramacrobiotus metropolitanus TaxID=2943436 RepID=UPI002445A1BB|nr:unconventional myosin-IXAa-like isoform X2 [Paramacrobiotus metropolitanus]